MSSKPVFGPVPPPQPREDSFCNLMYPNLRGLSKESMNALLHSLATKVDPASSAEAGGYRIIDMNWTPPGSDMMESHHAVWFGPRETPLLTIATAPWYHLCDNDTTRPAPVLWADVIFPASSAVKSMFHERGTVKPEQIQRFEEDFKYAYATMVSKFPGERRGCLDRFLELLRVLRERDSFIQNNPMDVMKSMIFSGAGPGMVLLDGKLETFQKLMESPYCG
ncbi:hypothetical protein BD410DRAFT_831624 [Rickenella mellea]|uniref:Uncharacterized protein n=1 Tax=Rickenella mellea TaxID=50990 RepID=A0A4Y7PQ38_9AGAM|nr:hypothetical protein BD410DRAFT_831624 [Rickenella mellea]